jgi:hypothetical protein
MKHYVICRTTKDFVDWRDRRSEPINRTDCVPLATNNKRATDLLRRLVVTAEDEIHRIGDYDAGPYWHDIEDCLAACAADGVSTGGR